MHHCDRFPFVKHFVQNLSINSIHSTTLLENYYEMVKDMIILMKIDAH